LACPVVQDSSRATRAPRLTKADGLIDWSCPSGHIHNRVRAMQPWPRAYTHWLRDQGELLRLIVHRVTTANEEVIAKDSAPGTVLCADSRLLVATGDGPLEVLDLQPAGKKKLTAGEFLRGYPIRVGDRLEEIE
jgi:methionyl-tRNA formyltransferase